MTDSMPTMVKSVHVQNFKCLRDVHVDLEPLTVLIGKNDTGKSSLLEAIAVLAYHGDGRSQQGLPGAEPPRGVFKDPNEMYRDFVRRGSQPGKLQVTAIMTNGKRHDLTSDQLIHGVFAGVPKGPNHLDLVQFPYRFNLSKLRLPASVGQLDNAPLPSDGEHLAAALDRLQSSTRQFTKLQDELRKRLPLIHELRPTPVGRGAKEIWFDVDGAGLIHARQMSDGVMLILAILTVLYDENAPKLIMLEEPETGIHPKQLELLVEAFAAFAKERVQILLTTHSPYVLDFVSRDCVRVFARDAQGEVKVKPLSELDDIRDMVGRGFTLGEAWYNTDENALLHKAPDAHPSVQ